MKYHWLFLVLTKKTVISRCDKVLTIQGQSRNEIRNDQIQYLYKGIAGRAFEQKFRLEQFVEVKDAKLSNGLLSIHLKEITRKESKRYH